MPVWSSAEYSHVSSIPIFKTPLAKARGFKNGGDYEDENAEFDKCGV
jgi:hypothetical protein